jgi:hypothetical protein
MRQKNDEIAEEDLRGLKYFKVLSRFLQRLHKAGCENDRAGNRILHMDQYMTLLLLCMFSPVCESLRSLQRASELKKVQEKLGVPRCSLGSLSEAARVFDSDLLGGIIGELASQLKPIAPSAKLKDIDAILTIVDGTLLTALPKTIEILLGDRCANSFKAHVQYELFKSAPVQFKLTDGKANEKAVLAGNLDAGRFYVLDRGYAKFELLQQIVDNNSNFACRIRDDAIFEVIDERPIDADGRQAGIERDMVVRLGSGPVRDKLKQPVRIIKLKVTEQTEYSAVSLQYKGRKAPESMLISTDRLDLDADAIALIYKYRWQIEIFFRFFKHVLGCRHLLSYSANGIELQVYAAIIACLVIALYTGRKPTKHTHEIFCWFILGWADEDEVMGHVANLQQQAAK